ncbi:MAG: folylpolyglutamate synthase/dihydrofolate synthase, partial [Haloarculaceae archaeon]
MEYHEVVNTLEGLRRLRPKLGTGTTASLLDYLDTDPETMTAVQVAGSNGKGSTARLLERILRETGLTVGLYTSPDLNGLRERIRVCGQKIPKPEVVRYVEEVWPFVVEQHVEGNAPTFFEVTTALALWYFDRQDVDVAVLEVGIGGRYDSTSVVDPVAAAVTSVSLEHTDILGETVEAIARDKAHVAPEDAPLVTGATGSALEEIRKQTDVVTVGNEGPSSDDPGETASRDESASSVDVLAREREMVSLAESSLSLVGPDWEIETATPLLGQHQAVNAGIAAALARQAADVSEDDIAAGIRNVYCPGRFEVMDDAPLVVLDGAHNPDACAKLATVMERFDYETLDVVFGAMRDKDHREMLRRLPDADRVSLAAPDVDRAQDTDTLASVVGRETNATREQFDSVLGALEEALRSADESDCVLVTGSLYAISEARDRWTRAPTAVRTHSTQQVRSVMASADVPDDTQRQYVEQGVMRTVRFHTRRSTADR